MKKVNKLIQSLGLLVLLAPLGAMAATTRDVNILCTAPIERVDGTPLLITEIDHFHFVVEDDLGIVVFDVIEPTCASVAVLPRGLYTLLASAVDTTGLEGDSAVILVDVKSTSPPKAPTGLDQSSGNGVQFTTP